MIRILLVDDQPLVRSGFRMLLEVENDLTIVGEAGDGIEAIELAIRCQPDVILMDIQMPRLDGLAATERILTNQPEARILLLTTFETEEYIFEALRLGASGFMLKNSQAEQLVEAIRVVAAGEALLGPSVTRTVISSFAGRKTEAPAKSLATLTRREEQVMHGLARGLSNTEIANELMLGEATIKTYTSSILSKLGLRDRIQAVIFAYENGLV